MEMRCVIAHATRAAVVAGLGLGSIALLNGCTTTRSEPYRTVDRPSGGNQGSAADLVMNDPELDEFAGYFDGRSDDRLAVRGESAWVSNVLWPEPAPPTLSETRRIFLPTRAESVIFFQPDQRGRYLFRYEPLRPYPQYQHPGYRYRGHRGR